MSIVNFIVGLFVGFVVSCLLVSGGVNSLRDKLSACIDEMGKIPLDAVSNDFTNAMENAKKELTE